MKSVWHPFLLASMIAVLSSSCTSPIDPTSLHFREGYGPSIQELDLRSVRPSEVVIMPLDSSLARNQSKFNKWRQDVITTKKLTYLGISSYRREGQTSDEEIRRAASRIGARFAFVTMQYAGKGQKSIMAPISHTPGRTITQYSDHSGTVSGNASTSGLYGNTPYFGTTHATANYSGTSSSSTYIPGSTTYGARNVTFDAFEVLVVFFTPNDNLSEKGVEKMKEFALQLNEQ